MMIWENTPGTPAAQQDVAIPAATSCGCSGKNAMQQRAKILQLMIMVAYALLIIYLFKAITK